MTKSNADILEEPTRTSAARLFARIPTRMSALLIAVMGAAVIYGLVFLWLLFAGPPEPQMHTNDDTLTLELAPAQGTVDTHALLRGDQVTREAQTEVLTVLRTAPPSDTDRGTALETNTPTGTEPNGNTPATAAEIPDPSPKIESAFVLPINPPQPEEKKEEPKERPQNSSASDIAPNPNLLEDSKYGPVPIVSKSGEKAWQAYASPTGPLPADRPIVALVIGGMGISENSTNYAITQLPAAVTLAFAPYGTGLQRWMNRARAQGHETLIELPMEPFDYPNNDPGPYTLLAQSEPAKNLDRLQWLLSRGAGYVGVSNYQGARFVADTKALKPIFSDLQKRGLMYVDHPSVRRSRAKEIALAVDMPLSKGTSQIDPKLNKFAIDEALLRLEEQAKRDGVAVGFGSGFPLTIDRIDAWSKKLEERGVTLVPVSATVSARYKLQ